MDAPNNGGGQSRRFLEQLLGGGEEVEYENIGPMTSDETKMYNEIEAERKDLEQRASKARNNFEFFWTLLRKNRTLFNKYVRINTDTGMIEVKKED